MKTNFSNMHYNNFKHPIRIIALRIYSIHIFHRIINGTKDLESWVKFRIGRPFGPEIIQDTNVANKAFNLFQKSS